MSNEQRQYPLIAAITRTEQITAAINSDVRRINLMAGDILQLESIVERVHAANKQLYVHIEMVNGISRDSSGVHFLAKSFKIDGIVSTKSNAIASAKQAGLGTTQRIFAIDTAAIETALKMMNSTMPDEVELMPGLMPRIISQIRASWNKTLIVGGLIRSEEEIRSAFEHGADYVSLGDSQFW